MAKIDKKKLIAETKKAREEALKKEAFSVANRILEEEKVKYINDIKTHPISQELANGPTSENISKTLDGPGNLFSFIGFNEGENPVQDLVDIIDRNTTIKQVLSKDETFKFEVLTPSLDELKSVTPMPFEGGNSWLKGIENGISGFTNYLYGLMFPNSRSGKAIQIKNKLRRTNYRPTKYFSLFYAKFLKSFR